MGGGTRIRASLLDRLVGLGPGSPQPHLHRPSDLSESVRRDLEHLLSTRCRVPGHVRRERGRSVLDYGMQDLSHLSTTSQDDCLEAAAAIREAVEACEPRLRQVRVEVISHPDQVSAFQVMLHANLVAEEIEEPVLFPFVVHR